MKVVWETEDIKIGRRIQVKGRSEIWIIGYISDIDTNDDKYVIVSSIDGMVCMPAKTKSALAETLSEEAFIPFELIED